MDEPWNGHPLFGLPTQRAVRWRSDQRLKLHCDKKCYRTGRSGAFSVTKRSVSLMLVFIVAYGEMDCSDLTQLVYNEMNWKMPSSLHCRH